MTLALGLVLCLGIGISLGLLGGGGSILTVPVLHYVFGYSAHDAVAMSLVVVGITSAISVIPYARSGLVQWRDGLVFGSTSMIAAFLGARIGAALPGDALLVAFAVLMLAAGVMMVLRSQSPARVVVTKVHPQRLLAIGAGVGLLTGILGAGGGFIIVPALTLVGGMSMRKAVGTSLFLIALNSLAGLSGAVAHAHLDATLTIAVTLLAVIGSLVGVRLSHRLSVRSLQRSFAVLVMTVAAFILVNFIL